MTISHSLDLILNLEVFAFIGVMVWLYFKDFGEQADGQSHPEEREES